jgi:2-polyprenyl-3-methyl-5-hydroxy-6-metoxy-1,4-benzoquinol methylase
MTREAIERGRQGVIDRVGPWTNHNICLGHDVFTRAPRVIGDEVRARRILQIVSDLAPRPLSELRVLDLGCAEGLFAIEMALHGASTVGIEGRAAPLERARFAKAALGLEDLTLVQDDVRNLSRATHGDFDVVLCLGILYHLDAPAIFDFLERLADVSRGIAIIDTHVGMTPRARVVHRGETYAGRWFIEHRRNSTAAQREALFKASLDNPRSFWPTLPSLCNALARAGFSSVHECRNPSYPVAPLDRVVLVALKRPAVELRSSPLVAGLADPPWPERNARGMSVGQRWYYPLAFWASRAVRPVPGPVKRLARSWLGRRS